MFVGSIVVGFIVTGSESIVVGSVVIRSVVVESVAADRNVLQIILAAVFHCLLPSVLWVYAPVNWGVGSVFQPQKIHIYLIS